MATTIMATMTMAAVVMTSEEVTSKLIFARLLCDFLDDDDDDDFFFFFFHLRFGSMQPGRFLGACGHMVWGGLLLFLSNCSSLFTGIRFQLEFLEL
jgi:hypothetical protein